MLVGYLKAKIHRAVVRDANLEYEGSVTVGKDLLEASGIGIHEQVDIYNITNGERLTTYVIPGDTVGDICLNGAAAWKAKVGDQVIIVSYCQMTPEEARTHRPRVVLIEGDNRIKKVTNDFPGEGT